jgi:hypothetical protein
VATPSLKGHPNRAAFRGVLTVVDAASQRAPSGSKGKRVLLTREAAEAALPSLIGMALDYAPSYDRHDVRRKVGVITSAEIVGRDLQVAGYLYAKDFPDVVEEIGKSGRPASGEKLQASGLVSRIAATENMGKVSRLEVPISNEVGQKWAYPGPRSQVRTELKETVMRLREMTAGLRKQHFSAAAGELSGSASSGLGMSFEVANVTVADERARLWTLLNVTFTGAAILRRDRAAYEDTWIALSPEL